MLTNTLIFFSYSVFILFSTLGYGLVFTNNLFGKSNDLNIPLKGLFGLIALYLISSFTHLFVSHNFIHNIFLIFLGIIFFVKNINVSQSDKKNLKYIIFFFVVLYLGFLISKNNEDFPYYHLPNSLQFAEHKLQFGLGNLNHGFKHYSSLFLINSLFYLPKVEFYLFNITNFLVQIFFFSCLFIILFKEKYNNFTQIFVAITFLVYLGKFYRLSEYGADYVGQFMVILGCIYSFKLLSINNKNLYKVKSIFYISCILILFAITTKFMYIIYTIIPFTIYFLKFSIREISYVIFYKKFFIISIFLFLTVLFFNFTSTGCLVYPVNFTCLHGFADWTLDENLVNSLSIHYESWSKAGKGTGYELQDLDTYVSGLNWFNFWLKNYFFNKVSDFILVIIFVTSLFFLTFYKNIKNINKSEIKHSEFLIVYLSVILVLMIWFFNFPTLRYAGYSILFIFLTFPICLIFSKVINFRQIKLLSKMRFLIILVIIIFNIKNLERLNYELNIPHNEHHNFKNFPFFWINNIKYKEILINDQKFYEINGSYCWSTPPTCLKNTSNLETYKINNYIFYKKK